MPQVSHRLHTALIAIGAVLLAGAANAGSHLMIPEGSLQSPGVLHLGADFAAAPNQFINAVGDKDGLNRAYPVNADTHYM